jgi:hypothetical protein
MNAAIALECAVEIPVVAGNQLDPRGVGCQFPQDRVKRAAGDAVAVRRFTVAENDPAGYRESTGRRCCGPRRVSRARARGRASRSSASRWTGCSACIRSCRRPGPVGARSAPRALRAGRTAERQCSRRCSRRQSRQGRWRAPARVPSRLLGKPMPPSSSRAASTWSSSAANSGTLTPASPCRSTRTSSPPATAPLAPARRSTPATTRSMAEAPDRALLW